MLLNRIIKDNIGLFYIISISLLLGLITNYFIHIYPDIFLVLIVFLTLYYPAKISFYTAVILGGLRDILSSSPFGFYILVFLLCRLVIHNIKNKIYPGKVIIDVFIMLISAIILYLFLVSFSSINKTFYFNRESLKFISAAVFFTVLLSIPLFVIFKQIKSLKAHK